MLFGPVVSYTSVTGDGTVTTGTVSGVDYLLGAEGGQFALLAWPVLLGALALAGGLGAWRGRTMVLGAVAAGTTAFAILGMMSIGLLFAPAALLFVLAAAAITVGG